MHRSVRNLFLGIALALTFLPLAFAQPAGPTLGRLFAAHFKDEQNALGLSGSRRSRRDQRRPHEGRRRDLVAALHVPAGERVPTGIAAFDGGAKVITSGNGFYQRSTNGGRRGTRPGCRSRCRSCASRARAGFDIWHPDGRRRHGPDAPRHELQGPALGPAGQPAGERA